MTLTVGAVSFNVLVGSLALTTILQATVNQVLLKETNHHIGIWHGILVFQMNLNMRCLHIVIIMIWQIINDVAIR